MKSNNCEGRLVMGEMMDKNDWIAAGVVLAVIILGAVLGAMG